MRLVLDEHFPAAVAAHLREMEMDVVIVAEWLDGIYRTKRDPSILGAARTDMRVVVTYDCHTFPDMLRLWAAEDERHAGVILVDERTIRSNDVGGLVKALSEFVQAHGDEDWTDKVMYLPAASK